MARRPKEPPQFIVIEECSAGNESVGSEWLETATFPPTATLADVWAWSLKLTGGGGRLMIRPDIATDMGAPF